MKNLIILSFLFASLNTFAGEFHCKLLQHYDTFQTGEDFLTARETLEGLEVTALGQLAIEFNKNQHVFRFEFEKNHVTSSESYFVEGNEHETWVFQMRIPHTNEKSFFVCFIFTHFDTGPGQELKLACQRLDLE